MSLNESNSMLIHTLKLSALNAKAHSLCKLDYKTSYQEIYYLNTGCFSALNLFLMRRNKK